MTDLLPASILIFGIIFGAVLATFLGRSRTQAQIAAAVSKAEATGQAEIAQLRERVRAVEESRGQVQGSAEQFRKDAAALQDELEVLGQERATLRERATNEEGARLHAESAAEQLKRELAKALEELEISGKDAATLRERAAQVSVLVSERDAVSEQLRASQDEGRRLSNEVSDQAASLRLLKERVPAPHRGSRAPA